MKISLHDDVGMPLGAEMSDDRLIVCVSRIQFCLVSTIVVIIINTLGVLHHPALGVGYLYLVRLIARL